MSAAPVPGDGLELNWPQMVGFGELVNSEVADIPVNF